MDPLPLPRHRHRHHPRRSRPPSPPPFVSHSSLPCPPSPPSYQLSAALCAPRYSRLLLLRISSRTRTASCSLLWFADMHPKFHASSSFVTSTFLQYLANAVRACWGVIAFGSAFVPALYHIALRWLLYESPYDHVISLPSLPSFSADRTITCAAALPNCCLLYTSPSPRD